MIGGQSDAPRVGDEQQQFEADRPLDRVDEVLFLVHVGDDAAAGLVLHVEVAPLPAGEFVQQVLPRPVGGDGDGVAEQHRAGVARQVRVGVEVLGDRHRRRLHGEPVVAAVGVVLEVRHVGAVALQHLHRFEGGGVVARRAEVVAVQVNRVRQRELVRDVGERLDDLGGRDGLVAGHHIVQSLAVLPPLPPRDAAGVHRLDAVGFRGPHLPRGDVLGPLELLVFEQVEDDLVVRHQHAAAFVDDGRVAEFLVCVLGGEEGHRGLVGGSPAHAGVHVARGEGGGRGAGQAGAALGRVEDRPRLAVLFGDQSAGEVERRPRDVGVNVHPAGEDDHAGRVDGARAVIDASDDLPAGDADVLHHAVDAVLGVVDPAARDPNHVVVAWVGFWLISENNCHCLSSASNNSS